MKPRILIAGALLCALPASGGPVQTSAMQLDALTTIDTVPARSDLDFAFGASTSLGSLIAIANDPGQDLGVQIRAIRVLPQYCTGAPGCPGQAHDNLVGLVTTFSASLAATLSPQDMLRLRAAVEALGATRSGRADDVHLLAVDPLLTHANRDIQVTTVHALRDLCSRGRCDKATCSETDAKLRELRSSTDETQLDAAVNSALQELAQCNQP